MPQKPNLFRSVKWNFRRVFILCFAVAAVLYLPYLIADGGLFRYAGDFNSQQINFYQYSNTFVKNGGNFSWETDLGSDFVNSYSFYLVGSPFWWLSLLIPSRVMPFCMVPFLCLKYAVAGGGAWLWSRRYTRSDDWAAVAAMLYAFSGFTVYNAFFNHFLDVVALFPFLLWALDGALHEGRHGWLALLVALNLLNNYFFFAGQIVFLFIYFFCKLSAGEVQLTGRLFAVLAFESLLGCCMGCLLAWPALLSLMQNPRTVDLFSGYDFLFYTHSQQYAAILSSFFLVPDTPYIQNLWSDGVTKWTSLTAYLPLASCAGVITWLRQKPGSAFKRVLCTCLVFALVPVLNSSFYALNSSFYARWYYMPVLVMALCTASSLEENLDQLYGTVVCVIVCSLHLILAVLPQYDKELDGWKLGVVEYPWRMVLFVELTVGGVLVYRLLSRYCKKENRAQIILAAVLAATLIYGWVHIGFTKLNQWDADLEFDEQCYTQGPQLEEWFDKGHFFRIDSYGCYDNLGLWCKTPCIQFFNSTVEPNILHFYPELGVTRDVSSKPEQDIYALRGLLSVEYLAVTLDKEEEWLEKEVKGWTRADEVGSYAIYRNENYVPMGFTYDYYLTEEDFSAAPRSYRSNLLMKAILLTEEQIERYEGLLEPLPDEQLKSRSYESYTADCSARRAAACDGFTAEPDGFSATITLQKQNLVFFSVPYNEGFTATINGQPAQVERVDNGMMAVYAPAGRSEMVFRYRTPGLAESRTATLAGVMMYIVYLALLRLRKKNEPETLPPLPHSGAASQITHMEEQ